MQVDAEHACFLFGVSLHYADTFFQSGHFFDAVPRSTFQRHRWKVARADPCRLWVCQNPLIGSAVTRVKFRVLHCPRWAHCVSAAWFQWREGIRGGAFPDSCTPGCRICLNDRDYRDPYLTEIRSGQIRVTDFMLRL